MKLTKELEAELRATIHPAYANVRGTESFERSIVLGEIDKSFERSILLGEIDRLRLAVAAEREACAEYAEGATAYLQFQTLEHYILSTFIAAVIRARSDV